MIKYFLRKGGGVLCRKLDEIHNLQPDVILNRYFSSASSPCVSIKSILNAMDIRYLKVDFSPLEKELYLQGNDAILGMASSKGNDLYVLYSDRLDTHTANYVLAHELAHCCLHLPVSTEFHIEMKTKQDIYSADDAFNRLRQSKIDLDKEKEADEFAANILIPTHALINYLHSHDAPTIQAIAETFKVPDVLVHKKIDLMNQR